MTSPMAIMATIEWYKNPYKKTKEVKVNKVSKRQISVMLILAVCVTMIFYFFLRAIGNANLFFSTLSITTSFVASYLTYLRSPYYALAYSLNDIVLIVLWILASVENVAYIPMIFCFVMFLVNDIYGFLNWKKMMIKQEKQNGPL
jgi:nicotinamide mononucleotide transporter PnuC